MAIALRNTLPPTNSLVVFEAAARHRNFTRAAEEMQVTQSAVSRQIQLLSFLQQQDEQWGKVIEAAGHQS